MRKIGRTGLGARVSHHPLIGSLFPCGGGPAPQLRETGVQGAGDHRVVGKAEDLRGRHLEVLGPVGELGAVHRDVAIDPLSKGFHQLDRLRIYSGNQLLIAVAQNGAGHDVAAEKLSSEELRQASLGGEVILEHLQEVVLRLDVAEAVERRLVGGCVDVGHAEPVTDDVDSPDPLSGMESWMGEEDQRQDQQHGGHESTYFPSFLHLGLPSRDLRLPS